MNSVPFDRFLQDLAELDVYPDPSDIQEHDVEAIWDQIPATKRQDYLGELGIPAEEVETPHLEGAEVVFPETSPETSDEQEAAGPASEEPDQPALEAARALGDVNFDDLDALEERLSEGEPALEEEIEAITEAETQPVAMDDGDGAGTDVRDEAEPVDVVADPAGDVDEALAEPVEAETVAVETEEVEAEGADTDVAAELGEIDDETLDRIGTEEDEDSSVREVEVYPVYEPYGYVRISYDEDDHQYLYSVIEPDLSEREEKILDFIQETIVDVIDVGLSRLTEAEAEEMLVDLTNEVISDYSIEVDENTRLRLTYYIVRDFLGYGKLDVIMRDPMIEDVNCDGVGVPIFLYHRKYESVASTVTFDEHEELDSFVIKLAQRSGKHISIADPLLDARLPDGSRLNATLSDEVTTKGSTFTIRKFREEPFTPPDLIRFGTMSNEMLAYFWMAIQHGASMIVAGGTASGKTTLLNAVMLFIPPQMKIVSIEDTRELNLPHPNWIPGTTRSGFGSRDEKGRQAGEIDMFQLLKAALRQRPEYITVGEVRGEEATVLFQAMATGHAAYGTMHADSVTSVIHRLEGEPINIPRPLLEALDIVCIQIQTRIGGKRVRRTKEIVEIVGMDPNTKELLTNEVFAWDPADDTFEPSGISYVLERIQKEENLTRPELEEEIDNRTLIIEWMKEHEVRDYRDVGKVVQAYYNQPEELMVKVRYDLGLVDGEEPEGILEEIFEEEPAEEDEDEFDPTAEIPIPDDEAAVSPLEEEELAAMGDVSDEFDPVQDAYESDEEKSDEATGPLEADSEPGDRTFGSEGGPAHEPQPVETGSVDAEPVDVAEAGGPEGVGEPDDALGIGEADPDRLEESGEAGSALSPGPDEDEPPEPADVEAEIEALEPEPIDEPEPGQADEEIEGLASGTMDEPLVDEEPGLFGGGDPDEADEEPDDLASEPAEEPLVDEDPDTEEPGLFGGGEPDEADEEPGDEPTGSETEDREDFGSIGHPPGAEADDEDEDDEDQADSDEEGEPR